MSGLTEALFVPYRPVCNIHAYCVEILNTSVQVQGTCSCFLTKPVCKVRGFHHLAQPLNWRINPCRLSATVYSIYSQISSILEAVPPSVNEWRVISLWEGPTDHHLEEPEVDWRIILRWICRKWYESMDWIDVAQDRDRWRALLNAAVNLRVPLHAENFLTSWELNGYSRRTLLHAVSE
jgi:hypothetical protein